MGKYYEQLSLSERVYIQAQLELGFKAAAIATALKRNPSTVSRELWRNGWAGPARPAAIGPTGHSRGPSRRPLCPECLVHLQSAVLFAPAVIRLLGDRRLFTSLRRRLAARHSYLNLP